MASKTDIANLALQKLGEVRINSLTDEADKSARVCNINYDHARDTVLTSAKWRFAKKQTTISKLAAAPSWKWQAAYQLPADCLRLTEIEGDDVWTPKEYFDIQGKKLLTYPTDSYDTPADSLNIEYIAQEDDPTLYDAMFVECLSTKLAELCARSLTGSDTKADQLTERYETVDLPKAMQINGHQLYTGHNNPIKQILKESFMSKARRSSGTSNTGLDS